jgi:glycosyltransferase involved in cell wall biosynthesis
VRIAFVSPLPPLDSGIADYAATLAPGLAATGLAIDLFFEGRTPPPAPLATRLAARPVRELAARAGDYDVLLYHLGNSLQHHAGMLELLLELPGVVVLHEYMLHHLFRERTLAAGDAAGYVEEMRYAAGETGRRAARRQLDTHHPLDIWAFPLFERVVDRSRAVFVHSRFAADRILASRPAARLEVVPFAVDTAAVTPVDAAARAAARQSLDLPADAFVLATFGFVTPQKRLGPALAAFARLRRARPDARFLIVGEVAAREELAALLAAHGRAGVTVTGRLPADAFERAIAACDVAVNLRHPTGGETSAALLHLLAAGVPTIVSNTGSFAEIPSGAVARVPLDDGETPILAALLDAFAADPALRAAVGAAGRRHVEREHALPGAASRWREALERQAAALFPAATVPPLAAAGEWDPRVALAAGLAADFVDLGLDRSAPDLLPELAATLADLGWAPEGR